MPREVIYHCAGPDCDHWTQSMEQAPVRGWIEIRDGDDQAKRLDLCSWDCVLKLAAAVEPTETL